MLKSTELALAAKMSLGGVVMGLVSALLGVPPSIEPAVWIALCAAWIAITYRRGAEHPFQVVLTTSVLTGLLTGAVQLLLLRSYVEHNPWYAKSIAGRGTAELAMVFLGQSLAAGVVLGAIGGAAAWRLDKRRRG